MTSTSPINTQKPRMPEARIREDFFMPPNTMLSCGRWPAIGLLGAKRLANQVTGRPSAPTTR
jgi:hypothetical protein